MAAEDAITPDTKSSRARRSGRHQRPPAPTDDEIRQIILRYLFDRNKAATSIRGKKGAAVKISDLRAALKASHGLEAKQVVGNLTYLISQGWVEEKPLAKSVPTPKGGIVPSVTQYYQISAAGIDKIGGPSEFMRDRFSGIRIEATGQNIITLGDGNQVNVRFKEVAEALSELRNAVKALPSISEEQKIDIVVDIDSIQDQLAKGQPNRTVIQTLWQGVERAATAAGLVDAVLRVLPLVRPLLPG